MKTARMIGNYAQHKIADQGIVMSDIVDVLQLNEHEMKAFFKGRLLLTYEQLSALAKRLNVSIQDLIAGDQQEYSTSVVHCMNEFDNEANREMILDIIDDYMDIMDSLHSDTKD